MKRRKTIGMFLALSGFLVLSGAGFAGAADMKNYIELPAGVKSLAIGGEVWMLSVNRQNVFFSETGGISNAGKNANWFELTAKLGVNAALNGGVEAQLGFITTRTQGEDNFDPFKSPRFQPITQTGMEPHRSVRINLANVKINRIFGTPVTVTAGRFEYTSLDGFVVKQGSIPTRGSSWTYLADAAWNGALFAADFAPVRIELLGVRTDESWDDLLGTKSSLFGATASLTQAVGPLTAGGLAFFARDDRGPGNLDTRVANLFLRAEPAKSLRLNGNFAYEFGKRGVKDVDAWAADLRARYTFAKSKLSPWVEAGYAYFTGDDGNPTKFKGYDPLFAGYTTFGTYKYGDMGADFFPAAANGGRVLMGSAGILPLPGLPYSTVALYYYHASINKPVRETMFQEIDLPIIYPYSDNLLLAAIGGIAFPGEAAKKDLMGIGSRDKTYTEFVVGPVLFF